jgi:hypothetical protein
VDVVLFAFGQPKPEGKVAEELRRLADEGTIRVLDAMFVVKGEDGVPVTMDIEDLPDAEREAYGFIETGTRGFFDSEDADTIIEGMRPGSAIVALAIEHAWALRLREALEQTGASLALDMRVPAAAVDDLYAVTAGR